MTSKTRLSPARRVRGLQQTLIRRINDMADPSCLDLGLGELAFPTPRSLREVVKKNIDRWHLGYSPNAGLPELRELIAAQSEGSVSPERVCVTAGSEEALFLSLAVLVEEGDEILLPDPGFPTYSSIARFFEGVPVGYRLNESDCFRLKTENLIPLVTERTKAVVINSPHNPTGMIAGEEELHKLSAYLEGRGIAVISDEAYGALVFDGPAVPPSRFFRPCFTLGSLSKTFSMTGWRLGWVIYPDEWAVSLIGLHQMLMMCASVPSQKVAVEALNGYAEEEVAANQGELRRRRDLAVKCLETHTDLPFIKPEGAFYIMVDIRGKREKESSLDVAIEILKKAKVITIPGIAFGPGGEGFLRLSFAPDPQVVEEGIRRIGHFFSP